MYFMLTLIVIFLYIKRQAEIACRLESNDILKDTKKIFFITDKSYTKRLSGYMLMPFIKDKYILFLALLIDLFILSILFMSFN